MSSVMPSLHPRSRPPRSLWQRLFGQSRWVPWCFVGLFAVMFLVNGIMVAIAFDSWTGLVERDHYRKGLHYNERLAAAEAQAALGWQVELGQENPQPGQLVLFLSLADREGMAFAADGVTAELERPSGEALDRPVSFNALQRGRYASVIESLPAGLWDLRVVLHKAADRYETVRRITVR